MRIAAIAPAAVSRDGSTALISTGSIDEEAFFNPIVEGTVTSLLAIAA